MQRQCSSNGSATRTARGSWETGIQLPEPKAAGPENACKLVRLQPLPPSSQARSRSSATTCAACNAPVPLREVRGLLELETFCGEHLPKRLARKASSS